MKGPISDTAGRKPSEDSDGHQHGSFFGRRKGHKLRAQQADLIEQLLPRLAVDIGVPSPPDVAAMFDPRADAVRLEIGFRRRRASDRGSAWPAEYRLHRLRALCQRHGEDPDADRSPQHPQHKAVRRATPPNCWRGLPPLALARIDLIHPDPWPKRRHWKRRFVQDSTVAAMARVLKPGGEFRFVSDIDDYCAWTLAHLARSPDFTWTAERASDWRLPWPDYTMTRYGREGGTRRPQRGLSAVPKDAMILMVGPCGVSRGEKRNPFARPQAVCQKLDYPLRGRRHQPLEIQPRGFDVG